MKTTRSNRHVRLAVAVSWGMTACFSLLLSARAQDNYDGPVSRTSYAYGLGESGGPAQENTDAGTTSAISKSYSTGSSDGYASATVSDAPFYPDLHATASVTAGAFLGASGSAIFTDTLDFQPTVNPSTGALDFRFDFFVSGSLSGANTNANLTLNLGESEVTANLLGGSQNVVFDFPAADNLMENDGTDPTTYYGLLTETLGAGVNNNAGAAMADFNDTVKLGKIEVYDANGNPVAGQFFDTYANGAHGPLSFPSNTNLLVPEPSPVVLVAVALIGAVILWRRRRSSLPAVTSVA